MGSRWRVVRVVAALAALWLVVWVAGGPGHLVEVGLEEGVEEYPVSGEVHSHSERFHQTLERRGGMDTTPQTFGERCQLPVLLPHIGNPWHSCSSPRP